jgi:hypothetical protein
VLVSQKVAKEGGGFIAVIPAEAGIQIQSDSWIPGRASYRQLARNDD